MIIGHEPGTRPGNSPHLRRTQTGRNVDPEGFRVPEGKPFIAVEDVVTTGGSVMEAAQLAIAAGGRLAGICSILNRSGRQSPFGEEVPYFSLLEVRFPTFSETDCPFCAQGIPIDAPGTRRAGE
ncbi:MAG: hypothetical protein IPI28_07515 [Candidatus Omnitrophica bacterium]|nr:hypothetical protein [Candidatus Omnitrophota bacterium]